MREEVCHATTPTRHETVLGRSFAVGRPGGVFWRSGERSARSYNKKPFNLLPRVYSLVCMRNSFQKLFTHLSTKPGEDHTLCQQVLGTRLGIDRRMGII